MSLLELLIAAKGGILNHFYSFVEIWFCFNLILDIQKLWWRAVFTIPVCNLFAISPQLPAIVDTYLAEYKGVTQSAMHCSMILQE